jgi:antirestriction protein ArdC
MRERERRREGKRETKGREREEKREKMRGRGREIERGRERNFYHPAWEKIKIQIKVQFLLNESCFSQHDETEL